MDVPEQPPHRDRDRTRRLRDPFGESAGFLLQTEVGEFPGAKGGRSPPPAEPEQRYVQPSGGREEPEGLSGGLQKAVTLGLYI